MMDFILEAWVSSIIEKTKVGWMLGEKYLNGRTALAEASYGRGKVVLFGFRPQHRGQTFSTFPLIFNSLETESHSTAEGNGIR